jgi:hypothetical protein
MAESLSNTNPYLTGRDELQGAKGGLQVLCVALEVEESAGELEAILLMAAIIASDGVLREVLVVMSTEGRFAD